MERVTHVSFTINWTILAFSSPSGFGYARDCISIAFAAIFLVFFFSVFCAFCANGVQLLGKLPVAAFFIVFVVNSLCFEIEALFFCFNPFNNTKKKCKNFPSIVFVIHFLPPTPVPTSRESFSLARVTPFLFYPTPEPPPPPPATPWVDLNRRNRAQH